MDSASSEQNEAPEAKKFKKVFTFSRSSSQDSASVSHSFPLTRPDAASLPLKQMPGAGQPQVTSQQVPGEGQKPSSQQQPGQQPATQSQSAQQQQPTQLPQMTQHAQLIQPPQVTQQPQQIPVTSQRPIDLNLPAAGPPSVEKSSEKQLDGKLSPEQLPQYPTVYITALREKLSYMVNFQLKVTSLAKQLKTLMSKTANNPPPPGRKTKS